MKNILLIANEDKDIAFSATDKVAEELLKLGFLVYVDAKSGYKRANVKTVVAADADIDLVIVVGGDGSVIDASVLAIEKDIPILGVNLGKVGYLAELELENLSMLKQLKDGDYVIKDKMLLTVSINGVFSERLAINDVVISREGELGIADIRVDDSLGNTVKYRADGVILSTPQGSTAYSLSSGGPIVAHDVETILLTPVSPHSFFNRSVLFNSSERITVTNTGASPLSVNVDGRRVGYLPTDCKCEISKSEKSVKMLAFVKNSMFSGLFRKMRIIGDMD